MTNPAIAPQSEQSPIEVTRQDLPLSCPRPDAPVWNMHPRVYLPIEDAEDGQAMCPYCGARYRLVD
ncbi:zinc-finger domain-containing protein [Imhoffiella purpurea]|uniref:Zinc finger CHCC-type domain-containing protein n=1 Tax=Imhoffiella purpurea TaxID=1249627 RepID=W9VBN7_9GAMM|nr:zinc-finger domain-containing protein [Imhoffiella purpurea]EXJ13457.1 hypothetical protein D779_3719 [Imhoffiella purpurea]